MQTLHTSNNVSEFLGRLVEAIRERKSPGQVCKRLIIAAITSGELINFERNEDGTVKVVDKQLIPMPVVTEDGTPIGVNGFVTSQDVNLAVLDLYDAAQYTFEGDVLKKEADVEVRSLVRAACKMAGVELGLKKPETAKDTIIRIDKQIDVKDLAAKLVANFSHEYLLALKVELNEQLEVALKKAA